MMTSAEASLRLAEIVLNGIFWIVVVLCVTVIIRETIGYIFCE